MLEAARLITPQGKTIELSPEIYKQVQELLARQPKRSSRARVDQIIPRHVWQIRRRRLTDSGPPVRTCDRARTGRGKGGTLPWLRPTPYYVLDGSTMLAYFQAESGGPIVRDLMQAAHDRNVTLSMSLINVGEVILHRGDAGTGHGTPKRCSPTSAPCQFTLCAARDEQRILAGARIKAEFTFSYADAFAVGLAQELDATLVTGDPEFQSVEQQISTLRLPQKDP